MQQYEATSKAVAGVVVMDLTSGRCLLEHRGGEHFIPASNQKILTAAFGLVRLGATFQFTTSVYRLGEDLVVVGEGDPTLGDPYLAEQAGMSIYAELDRWAAAIRPKLGQHFAGELILASQFAPEGSRCPDWPVNQNHRWYAAPAAGLNFHDNCFDVTFVSADGRIAPQIQPVSCFIEVVDRLAAGKRHVWSLRTHADTSQVTLEGTVCQATSKPYSAAVDHPPMLLGRVLADRLIRAGVTFEGRIGTATAEQLDLTTAELLCRTCTSLEVVLERANKRSLNLAAECLFLRAGDGTWAGSAKLMHETLVGHLGLDGEDFLVSDGGGLSQENRITPRAMGRLLVEIAHHRDGRIVLESLPISGIDGTLKGRLRETPFRGRIAAKTGYVRGASCLSGYVLDSTHQPVLAFAVLVNGVRHGKTWQAKQLQDRICQILVQWLQQAK